jgi:branched-chain amino acid aminotransferase
MKYCLDVKYYSENGRIKPIGSFPAYIAERSGLVYEVVKITNSIPLFLTEHIQRLNNSLIIQKRKPINIIDIDNYTQELIAKNNIDTGNIKIVIAFSQNSPKVFLYFIPYRYPSKRQIINGVKTKLQFDIRETPKAKVSNWRVRGNANAIIDSNNIYETILVNSEGDITEGSRSNIFFIKKNTLCTASDEDVLPGITRMKVLEIVKQLEINIEFYRVKYVDIGKYDACFLTGTSPGILQISSIDDVSFDISNPIFLKIKEKYETISSIG